ncbi:MAG: isocitrate lyase/PEP mutase family protein [Deltaproteobacteria bacterium]|nr:isocitrate lyase/PEP mutase family protein [Deltaproteobacteria bacterium]
MREKMSTVLRRRLQTEKALWNPLCYDAISARVFEHAGADVLAVSGYGISLSLLGMPDMGFISLPELVLVVRSVANSVSVPLIADADTGFGNALNVLRTTRELIQAGAAAMLIEDQLAPKRCGHVAGKEVIPLPEAVGKYRAAASVRDELDPDFVLVGRTDARGAVGGGLSEAIRRANAYLEAGVDVAFVEGLTTEEELTKVVREVKGPVLYNMVGISPVIPFPRLKEIGVSIVGLGIAPWIAARALWDYAHDVAERGVDAQLDFQRKLQGHALQEFHEFAGFPKMRKLEEKYLPSGEVLRKYSDSLGFRP